jgi:hypothetical protein
MSTATALWALRFFFFCFLDFFLLSSGFWGSIESEGLGVSAGPLPL